jgi:hypothetical protein
MTSTILRENFMVTIDINIDDYKQVGVYEYLLCKIKNQVG